MTLHPMCSCQRRRSMNERKSSAATIRLRHAGRRDLLRSACRSTSTTSTSGSSRLRGGLRREGLPADLVSWPVADSRRHRDAARLQLHRAGNPRVHPENCTGCMDCVTECPDTAILGKVLSDPSWKRSWQTIPEADREMFERPVVEDPQVLRGPQEEGAKAGMFNIIIDPSASARAAPSASPSATTDALKMIPKTDEVMTTSARAIALQEHRPVRREVHQRQPADRHDAQGADAHLRRRRRLVRRLRRGDRAAHAVRRHRRQVRRPVGHRRRHRLQHGLHLDLSVQPVPGAVDQLAVRERPGRRDGRAHALGPDGLAGQAAVVHRRRRGHVRHRLPVAVADARQRHEHQGVRARHAGLFEHRRPGLDQQLHRPEHQDERPRQGDSAASRSAARRSPRSP
jgi:ferredoxin